MSFKRLGPTPKDSFLNASGWEALLEGDHDRDFILSGVREGFHIVTDLDFEPAEVDNYTSALCPENREIVDKQIRT